MLRASRKPGASASDEPSPGGVPVIPRVTREQQGRGKFTITPLTRVFIDKVLEDEDRTTLATWVRTITGLELEVQDASHGRGIGERKSLGDLAAGDGDSIGGVSGEESLGAKEHPIIRMIVDQGIGLKQGGYELNVRENGIDIVAAGMPGLLHALQTLRQMLPATLETRVGAAPTRHPDVPRTLPCVSIVDEPRFMWRGFMLDVARHFFPVDVIEEIIDVLALLKMNVLHLHLTDDQGWRMEIEKYPRLVEIGAWRKESQVGGFLSKKFDGKPHGGYYTKEDLHGIIDHARSRGIIVVPEIEVPGHCTAALAAYPELSCTGGPFEVSTRTGIHKDIYCAGKENVFEFLEGVFDEVCEIFPSPYVHIGGDEAPKDMWRKCPACQARIESEGLKDEHELQVYMTRRIVDYLESRGKRAIGWNEVLADDLPTSVIAQYWMAPFKEWLSPLKRTRAHLEKGGQAIMSSYFHVYLDYNHGFTPLKKTYSYDPVPPRLPADVIENVLGIEAPMWTEFVEERRHLFLYIFPRLVAVAENAWTSPGRKDFRSFKNRLAKFLERLDGMGIDHSSIRTAQPGFLKSIILKAQWLKQASRLPE